MPAVIIEISSGSPFERLGVSIDSLLLAINNIPVDTPDDVLAAKEKVLNSGLAFTVAVFQNGEVASFSFTEENFGISFRAALFSDLKGQMSEEDYLILRDEIKNFQTAFDAGVDPSKLKNMVLTTTPDVPGHKVAEIIGVISAETVFGVNVIKEVIGDLTDTFGGRSKTQQRILRDARIACLHELKIEAAFVGADGVVGIDLDYSEISGGNKQMLFLVASGTAVRLED